MKLGVLTYNTVGRTGAFPNGWHQNGDHAVLVASHPRGQVWGVVGKNAHDQAHSCASTIQEAFQQIEGDLEQLDCVLVYVGDSGSEGAVSLVSRLPASKVHFVLCRCNIAAKMQLIHSMGLGASRTTLCECGGHATLERLVRQFLQDGVVA